VGDGLGVGVGEGVRDGDCEGVGVGVGVGDGVDDGVDDGVGVGDSGTQKSAAPVPFAAKPAAHAHVAATFAAGVELEAGQGRHASVDAAPAPTK